MRPGVRKLLAILGVCLVFVLGAAAGAAVTLRVIRHRAENLLTRHGSDQATERLARILAKRLNCDPAQTEQVAGILRSAHNELWEVRRDVTPRVREIYGRAVSRIRETLRPDQAKVFDETVARQTARLHLDENDSPTSGPTPVR